MNSFHKARLKLTGWYVCFVMLLSIAFSIGAYRFLALELEQSLRAQTTRIFGTYAIGGHIVTPEDISEIYNDAKNRILYRLIILNGGILILSSATAYFLAGKTLRPLEMVVEEQKRFIADASHELKTPLTSMRTEIEVALREKNLNLGDARELLKSNLEEVDKMKQLTNYLLALSRYENTDRTLIFESVYIADVVNRSLKLVNPKANEKRVAIIAETQRENFKIRANLASLEELLVILLDNAIKYSLPDTKVIVETYTTRTSKVIDIVDQGIGVKRSDIPYIFNRFYRADTSRSKHKTDGYGLGLSIAKSIVDLHKGKIEVESEVGKGSTFKIIFPR